MIYYKVYEDKLHPGSLEKLSIAHLNDLLGILNIEQRTY